ncbi:MAG TPA: FAD-dependent oxidoreductase [Actinomycetota bacterium]|nr:FAD-dependent oxidoreductase [Actinomycetota bacterium]
MRFDVAIVGAGVAGAAAARSAATAGARVVLFEQFDVGHTRGSSHGTSRIFRLSYPDATYVRMAQRALPLWRALERDASARLLTVTGGYDVGPDVDANARALGACGAPFEIVDGAEASRRAGNVVFGADERVLFQPDTGILAADATVAACVALAADAGADVRTRARVDALRQLDGGVDVVFGDDVVRARVAIVAAGAWARPLVAPLGIDLGVTPTRETVAYFHADVAPPVVVDWGDPAVYVLPAPGLGLKAGEHHAGPVADPDEPGEVSTESIARAAAWVRARVPGAAPEAHYAETCLYTNTPDEHFVMERIGDVVVGSACSGHGFKFAPLTGARLVALAGFGDADV